MRQKDVEIGTEGGKRKPTIRIYQSKTDQSQRGCFRTLMETDSEICPVRSMIFYLISFDWGCESDERLFADDVELRIRALIKWSATSNGLVSSKFSTHSLRSGGATAMYLRGISVEHIRRFGRWASDTFRRYLYRDNQVFRFVGSAMVLATGLLDQLQMTQPEPKTVHFEEDNLDEDEDEHFRVGGRKKPTHEVNPSPNTIEVNLSDPEGESESETTGRNCIECNTILPGFRLGSLPSADFGSELPTVNIPGDQTMIELRSDRISQDAERGMVIRERSHASSESSEEEEEMAIYETVITFEETTPRAREEKESTPWSRINPTICGVQEISHEKEVSK